MAITSDKDIVKDIMNGVLTGMAKLATPASIALIRFDTNDLTSGFVYDPNELLGDYQTEVAQFLRANTKNYSQDTAEDYKDNLSAIFPKRNRLIVNTYRSRASQHLQIWFVEPQPGWLSNGIIERYLFLAAEMLASASRRGKKTRFNPEPHSSAIELLGPAAVARQLARELFENDISIIGTASSFLDSITRVSTTLEEGERANGNLALLNPKEIRSWIARFSAEREQPRLANAKHVRKLLSVVKDSQSYLISDGLHLIGFAEKLPTDSLLATFKSGRGLITVASEPLCSFADGVLSIRNPDPQLHSLETLLRKLKKPSRFINDLCSLVKDIAKSAREERHGCTIMLDLSSEGLDVPGHKLLKLVKSSDKSRIRIFQSTSRVDGALHIDKDLKLRAFGCLMDGNDVREREDIARGSRYNSAIRFTTKHKKDAVVLTISEDGPLSIFYAGRLWEPPKKVELIEGELSVATL